MQRLGRPADALPAAGEAGHRGVAHDVLGGVGLDAVESPTGEDLLLKRAAPLACVQRIYDRLGSKAGLLVALVDVVDEESGATERIPRIFAATSGRATLREFVAVTRLFQ